MPFGIGLIVLQLGLAIHAYRTGRTQPWLYLLLFLPGFGCALYIVLELLPAMAGGRTGRRVQRDLGTAVVNVVAPGRRHKELSRAVEIAPTVQNKTALAEECLALGRVDEALALYRDSAVGLYARDPGVRLGLARALSAKGDFDAAATELETLGRDHPDHRTPENHLLYAAALNGAGRVTEALEQLQMVAESFPGEEARARYAQLLRQTGDEAGAMAQYREIVRRVELQKGYYKAAQRIWYDEARGALRAAHATGHGG